MLWKGCLHWGELTLGAEVGGDEEEQFRAAGSTGRPDGQPSVSLESQAFIKVGVC